MTDAILQYKRNDLSYKNLIFVNFSTRQKIETLSFYLFLLLLCISCYIYKLVRIENNIWYILAFVLYILIFWRILCLIIDKHTENIGKVIRKHFQSLNLKNNTLFELRSSLVVKKCAQLEIVNYERLLDELRAREQRWQVIIFGLFIAFISGFADKIKAVFFVSEVPQNITTVLNMVYYGLVAVVIVMVYYYKNDSNIELQKIIGNKLILGKD